jgi:hypothetical protein
MGRHDMVWPAESRSKRSVFFVRWTSEGAAPKDRPPLFEGGVEVVGGAVACRPPSDLLVPRTQEPLDVRLSGRPPSAPRLHLARVRRYAR